jgi:hypothetical protein
VRRDKVKCADLKVGLYNGSGDDKFNVKCCCQCDLADLSGE